MDCDRCLAHLCVRIHEGGRSLSLAEGSKTREELNKGQDVGTGRETQDLRGQIWRLGVTYHKLSSPPPDMTPENFISLH